MVAHDLLQVLHGVNLLHGHSVHLHKIIFLHHFLKQRRNVKLVFLLDAVELQKDVNVLGKAFLHRLQNVRHLVLVLERDWLGGRLLEELP